MNAFRDNTQPVTSDKMPVIPVAERHPHIDNPLSLKKISRETIAKRKIADERDSKKLWRKIRYRAIVAAAIFFIAVALRHKFSEIADFVTSIDLSTENIVRWFLDVYHLFF